ncbi:Snf7-domain-containing protein [Pisolithus marmoratus]|nr:Snf7-domain-containing protein [Pisolithus marmoratus]
MLGSSYAEFMASASEPLSSYSTYATTSKSRLQSLYSDVTRQKHSNPTSYHAHVDWWQRTLEELVSRGWQAESPSARKGKETEDDEGAHSRSNKLVLSVQRSLVDRLRFDGVGKPLGLGHTIAELRHSNALISLPTFLSSKVSVYDPGWLPYRIASFLVGKPLWWAMEQLDLVKSEDSYSEAEMWKRVQGDYVLLKLVERAADVVNSFRGGMSLADSLYTVESFRKEFGSKVIPGTTISETDTEVLLKYLERDRRILVRDKDVIKFMAGDREKEVTVIDRGILELKTAVGNLQGQVNTIQGKIDEMTARISTALTQQQKSIALAHLRHKKGLEEVLTKRLSALQNLESTLMNVETAAGNIEIMQAYEKSAVTLQTILNHPSLQRTKIDETMDALAAANATAREVDDAIRIGGDMAAAEAGIDDMDLEDELEELVKEVERETGQAEERAALEKLQDVNVPEQIPAVPAAAQRVAE